MIKYKQTTVKIIIVTILIGIVSENLIIKYALLNTKQMQNIWNVIPKTVFIALYFLFATLWMTMKTIRKNM